MLAALFTICMQTLFLSLSDGYPKWQLDESLIGMQKKKKLIGFFN